MSHLLARRKVTDYSEVFKTKPGDITIKDKNYPTKLECEVVRKKFTENLQGITCTDDRLNSMDWSAIIIKEEKYIFTHRTFIQVWIKRDPTMTMANAQKFGGFSAVSLPSKFTSADKLTELLEHNTIGKSNFQSKISPLSRWQLVK